MPPYWRNERACDMTLLALRDVLRACNNQVAFRVKADIERQAGSGGSVANDPKRRLRNVCCPPLSENWQTSVERAKDDASNPERTLCRIPRSCSVPV
jgi:hypothetical protein